MRKAESIKNIGPVSRQWLTAVGIRKMADLKRAGAAEVYGRVQELGLVPSLNLLWALEGAIQDVPFHALTAERKQELRSELEIRAVNRGRPIMNKNKSQNRK